MRESLVLYHRSTGTFKRSKEEFRRAMGWLFENNRGEIAQELQKYMEDGILVDDNQKLYKEHEEQAEEGTKFRDWKDRRKSEFEDWKEAFGPVMSAIEVSMKNNLSPEIMIDGQWKDYKKQSPYHEVKQ